MQKIAEVWFKEKSWMWMKPSCHVSTRNGDFPDVTTNKKSFDTPSTSLFQSHQMLSGVSINCEKVLLLRFLVSKILFVGCIDSNLFALYSLDLRQHIGYPQHLTKLYRNCSKVI